MAVETRTKQKSDNPSGIYLGLVVNHLDVKFNGHLEIELLKQTASGNLTERTGQIVAAKYMSPFYGVTPYRGTTKNNNYASTQKSYGFWAIPPDLGTTVIVVMPENNYGNAYWIGCVPEEYMNFMLPGNAGTTYNEKDKTKALPVGEYNKKLESGAGRDATQFEKPHNNFAFEVLDTQGLLEDHIRGTNTSSARREVPSMVFGLSTPGPVDKDGPTVGYGAQGSRADLPFNRLGGSSFVMDDGDMSLLRKKPASGDEADKMEYASVEDGETDGDAKLPANELIRLRTRTGHQILLHNTEDLIYIGNAKGSAWVELTGNGKIDIFSADSISIHTENDLNVTADRDINMKAGGSINMTAGKSFFGTFESNWEIKVGQDGKITCAGESHLTATTHTETAPDGISMNGTVARQADKAYIPKRVPQHEPWKDHEHLDPKKYIPDETKAEDPDIEKDYEEPVPFPTIPDTFKKPTS